MTSTTASFHINPRHHAMTSSLVILDSTVQAWQMLVDGIAEDTAVYVLAPDSDGVEQITQIVARYPHLTHLHVMAHGAPGTLSLGNTHLSLDTLDRYAPQLSAWFRTPNAQLLLYGCNLAAGDAGEEFLARLHRLTGAGIAASTQPVGNLAQGGTWHLDTRVGTVEVTPPLHPQVMATYAGLFDLVLREQGAVDTPAYAWGVEIVGNYAYVADAWSGLRIIDITDDTAPISVGGFDTPGDAFDVEIVGNYAYLADGGSGLQIIDISNPAAPTFVGSFDTPAYARGVEIVGNYAYLADGWSGGLRIVDISNPATPTFVGSFDTPGDAWDVEIVGNYAYLADGWSGGLRIVDISNPAAPTSVGSYDTPGEALDVEIVGNYAYLADTWSGLQIIDISNPAAPTSVGSYDTPGDARGVEIVGSYAYLADGGSGLQVVDISNPAAPTSVGSFDTPNYALEVQVVGDLIYVADEYSGLRILTVNTAPTATDNAIVVFEGVDKAFSVSDFPFTDPNPTDQESPKRFKITSLPEVGVLYVDQNGDGFTDGEQVSVGQEVLRRDLNKLRFKSGAIEGETFTNFRFQVSDGAAYGAEATLTIAITDTDPLMINVNGQLLTPDQAVAYLMTQNQDLATQSQDLATQNQDLAAQLALLSQRLTDLSKTPDAPPVIVSVPVVDNTAQLSINFGAISFDISRLGSRLGERIKGDSGNDRIKGKAGDDIILGLGGADFLFGDAGNDQIDGGSDSDKLDGGLGRDVLRGGDGRDLLLGGAHRDKLFGGDGGDILVGGGGADFLNGGAGPDVFRYGSVAEGGDQIVGFAAEDVIDLRMVFEQSAFEGVAVGDRSQSVRFVAGSTGAQVQLNAGGQFVTMATLVGVDVAGVSLSNVVLS